ncbi:MAG: hypothetical protein J6P00_01860 [Acetobacter sp.]|nr:hypothetical protein [Acetobacter sp.]
MNLPTFRYFRRYIPIFLTLSGCLLSSSIYAQAPGDSSQNQPVTITATGGFNWNQNQQDVIAYGNAKAVRGNVTITADQLTAYYRKKSPATSQQSKKNSETTTPNKTSPQHSEKELKEPSQNTQKQEQSSKQILSPSPLTPTTGRNPPSELPKANPPKNTPPNNNPNSGAHEIYRLEAEGHVHIFTTTDQAWGDKAVYDIPNAVLVLTGDHLRLTTPQDVLTARDSLEYYTQKHIDIGRGNAIITTINHRQIRADVLVSYGSLNNNNTSNAPNAPNTSNTSNTSKNQNNVPNKLDKVTAFGHIWLRTPTEIVTGDRGIYIPDTSLVRVVGNVHITRGPNQIEGGSALVNLKTGTATITGKRVSGLVVPNNNNQQQ